MMHRITAAALALPLAFAACGTAGTMANEPVEPIATTENFLEDTTMTYVAPPRPTGAINTTQNGLNVAESVAIPAGTRTLVRLNHPFGGLNDAGQLGSEITAEVIQPIALAGDIVIPQGAMLYGTVSGPIYSDQLRSAVAHVDFHSLQVNGQAFPIETKVRTVDPAVTDAGATLHWPGIVSAGDDEVMIPGAILDDPEWQFAEFERAPYNGTFISLGPAADGYLPQGTRLEVELIEGLLIR